MGSKVVQNHVNFLLCVIGNHGLHKIQKFPTTSAFVMTGLDLTGRNVQSSEQGGRTVAFVFVVVACDGFTVVQW